MRSLEQFLADYGVSHQNHVNQWVHIVCVPAIFFATLGLFWLIPIGNWLGLSGQAAYWVNGATVFGALSMLVYLKLAVWVFTMMAAWFALSFWGVTAIYNAGLPLGWISFAIFVVAWIGQFIGHKIEGKKPSFLDDLVFLLIGPIFVSVEFAHKLGLKKS